MSPFKVIALGGVAILAFAIGTREWQKSGVDHELEQRCAVDGGATIYERVTLPASRFSSGADRSKLLLGSEFRRESHTEHFIRGESVKGDLEFYKRTTSIVRVSDGKLISSGVTYFRRGGDGLWFLAGHPSGKHCPMSPKTEPMDAFVNSGF